MSSSETAISRSIDFFKGHRERKLLLEESVKAVMLSKDKEALNRMASNITTAIFGTKDHLSKEEFLMEIQNKPQDPMISIFILLLRA